MKNLYTNMVDIEEYLNENAEFFEENYPELTREEWAELAWEDISTLYWYDFERELQGLKTDGGIILAIADLGRWNGRFSGYKVIHSSEISRCLSDASGYDYIKFYTDNVGDFRLEGVHHDATDYITYREVKETTTEGQLDRLVQKIYDGDATRADITRYTRGLGKKVEKALGY